MNQKKRILCPVDLSENSLAAVEVATALARQFDSTIVFCYVSPQWLPEESMVGSDYIESVKAERRQELARIRPLHDAVPHDRMFLEGSPGPEIVRAADSCDMVVMSTHGYSGVLRLIMGSVAKYVSRHADCPVILVRNPRVRKSDAPALPRHERAVTDVMHQVGAIEGDDDVAGVIRTFEETRETAAPVVDAFSKCIGILTMTDIENYRQLRRRYEAGDESVYDEIFETNAYGQRRTDSDDFHHVRRHMTAPVVTISNQDSCRQACDLFARHPEIHHLVVVDDHGHPVGILESHDVTESRREESSGT
jgi:nucleotide-binding universal stress UspA family protein/predicted transcriptional regulator